MSLTKSIKQAAARLFLLPTAYVGFDINIIKMDTMDMWLLK